MMTGKLQLGQRPALGDIHIAVSALKTPQNTKQPRTEIQVPFPQMMGEGNLETSRMQ
jgi:hypothetical protein